MSACANPASTSPRVKPDRLAMLDGAAGLGSMPAVYMKSCRTGASGCMASSTSITQGSSSYSTSMRSSAASAARADVAATAARAWPAYSTLSRAMTLRLTYRRSCGPAGAGTSTGKSTRSAPDMTALTPSAAAARSRLMDLMRAWGCGLRSTLPQSMPGWAKSAPKFARPVTLSSPSGRIVLLPIHLLSVSSATIRLSYFRLFPIAR